MHSRRRHHSKKGDLAGAGTYAQEPKKLMPSEEDLSKYFPDTESYRGQQMSDKSLYSLSRPPEAAETTAAILSAFGPCNPKTLIVTDGTAHVGGNAINFARTFKHVNAVELEKVHFDMLENNIHVYELTNVSIYNDDYLKVLGTLKQDIVFLDVPFGGPNYYKINPNADYFLGKTEISDILAALKASARMVCFKVGINFNFTKFIRRRIVDHFHIRQFRGYNLVICMTR